VIRETSRRRTDTGVAVIQAPILFAVAAIVAAMGLSSSRRVTNAVMHPCLTARGLITQPNG